VSRCPAYHFTALFIALVCACNFGCGGREETGPPTLHLGSDVCDFCKMIISDQNFAAARIVRTTDGRMHSAAFDDIGCLLKYQQSLAGGTLEYRYVTDYDSGAWLEAAQAFYIQSSGIRSPMASGIIASQTQAGADRLADRFEGTVFHFNNLDSHEFPSDPEINSDVTTPATQPTKTTSPSKDGAEQEISE